MKRILSLIALLALGSQNAIHQVGFFIGRE